MYRLYVASMLDHNAGISHGVWVDCLDGFAACYDAISDMLYASPMTAETGMVAEETAILAQGGWYCLVVTSEHYDLGELCALAEALEEEGEEFAAYWSYRASGVSVEDAVKAFRGAYLGTYRSLAEWAEDYVFTTGMLDAASYHLRSYFDFERFARDCVRAGDIFSVETESGYIVFRNS